jgi:hypothetical protein
LWKSQALSNFAAVFGKEKPVSKEKEVDIERLYSQIGQQKVELDFLKKSWDETALRT